MTEVVSGDNELNANVMMKVAFLSYRRNGVTVAVFAVCQPIITAGATSGDSGLRSRGFAVCQRITTAVGTSLVTVIDGSSHSGGHSSGHSSGVAAAVTDGCSHSSGEGVTAVVTPPPSRPPSAAGSSHSRHSSWDWKMAPPPQPLRPPPHHGIGDFFGVVGLSSSCAFINDNGRWSTRHGQTVLPSPDPNFLFRAHFHCCGPSDLEKHPSFVDISSMTDLGTARGMDHKGRRIVLQLQGVYTVENDQELQYCMYHVYNTLGSCLMPRKRPAADNE